MSRRYSSLILLPSFKERFDYLNLQGVVGDETFGYDRYLNQLFYRSPEWRRVRDKVIIRDNGCDLGISDRPIFGKVLIHHLEPITLRDINERNPIIMDPENLICCSFETHNAIHYGSWELIPKDLIERQPNDTCPWKTQ